MPFPRAYSHSVPPVSQAGYSSLNSITYHNQFICRTSALSKLYRSAALQAPFAYGLAQVPLKALSLLAAVLCFECRVLEHIFIALSCCCLSQMLLGLEPEKLDFSGHFRWIVFRVWVLEIFVLCEPLGLRTMTEPQE